MQRVQALLEVGNVPELTPAQLEQLRKRSGWSQVRLAQALGVSPATWVRWEHGRAVPDQITRWWLWRAIQALDPIAPALPPAPTPAPSTVMRQGRRERERRAARRRKGR